MTLLKDKEIRSTRYAVIDLVASIKEASPCHDCGNKFPACCMDFDHRPGEGKLDCIGKLVMTAPWTEIEAEIAKCDLVCANCHRIRTRDRRISLRQQVSRELKSGLKTQREIAKAYNTSESLISELKRAAGGLVRRRQLTKEQRESIRQLGKNGARQRDLAKQFGCSQSHISFILNGKRGI